MLIKSLKMQNFRQFKGTTNIEFSLDPEKNVTIILGDNTFGKTTLLQAFNWCFYGKAMFEKNQNPGFLLNLEVAGELTESEHSDVVVEISVLHDGIEYFITRTQRYTLNRHDVHSETDSVKVSYRQPNGETETVRATEVKNVINNILPEDLSTYFFFDTERVNSISERRDVADAVKGLLGLTIIEKAMAHLGSRSAKSSVIGKWYANMDTDSDERASAALRKIQAAEDKRTAIAEQLEQCKSEINEYEARKEQLDDILRDNQTTSALQKKKDELERNIARDKADLEKITNEFFKEFSYSSLSFFAQPLLKTTAGYLKDVKVDDKGVRDLTKPTIEELIKRGYCICGAEIKNGNDAYKHLMDELSFVPPESIGNTVRHYREKLSSFSRPAERGYENLQNRYKEIYRYKTRIQDAEDELNSVSEQIKGKENMRRYEEELSDVKKRLRDQNDKKDRLIRDDAVQDGEISRNKKLYDSLAGASDKNKEIMAFIHLAEGVHAKLSESYSKKEGEIREALEQKVNEIFEMMYHGHRRVAIDQKYQVSLLTTVADKEIAAGESEGSNRVKNFAFIAGLVALAKGKINSDATEDEIVLSSEPYPLVMDAPFSNADETHTASISKVLPSIAEQVIMFVMHKDWRYAETVMADKVGKQYQLNKISETFTKIQ